MTIGMLFLILLGITYFILQTGSIIYTYNRYWQRNNYSELWENTFCITLVVDLIGILALVIYYCNNTII
jgi:small-conductance mechanosensitive channel